MARTTLKWTVEAHLFGVTEIVAKFASLSHAERFALELYKSSHAELVRVVRNDGLTWNVPRIPSMKQIPENRASLFSTLDS
jgi:hypothetical protein